MKTSRFVVCCLVMAAVLLLVRQRGLSSVANAPREVTNCITQLHDYHSIDKLFDEIILEPRKIVFWTPFYGSHDYGFGLGQSQTFIDHRCDIVNCVITSNKSAVAEADSVVFHLIDFLMHPKLPPSRTTDQRYVLFLMEPPEKLNKEQLKNLQKYNSFFNFTMTYKTDSSVYNPANAIVRRKVEAPKALQHISELMKKKTKMVALFTDCNESPMAKAYVNELKKHISVDVYGPCGTLKCGNTKGTTCWDLLEKEYRFYLSIESYMCEDYIGANTYQALQHSVLPLIYGAANYTKSFPPNSVIDIFDYYSAKTLADYLHKLAKHDGALLWHMNWRKDWEFMGWGHGFCDLCKVINTPKYPVSTVENLPQFFSMDQCGKDYMSHFKRNWGTQT